MGVEDDGDDGYAGGLSELLECVQDACRATEQGRGGGAKKGGPNVRTAVGVKI